MSIRGALLGAGAAGTALAVALDHRDVLASAARTWPPFVLVGGLLLVGAVANDDGVFAAAGRLLDRLPGGELALYLAAMGLVALVTVFLNLDTSVAFLTPALIYVARQRRVGEARLLYGCVFMSNAASLLLPGSNLTNLLVIAGGHLRGAVFLGHMLAPWCASVAVTAAAVAVAFRRPEPDLPVARHAGSSRPGSLSLAAIALAAVLILSLPDAAVPVAAIGLALAAVRTAQKRMTAARVAEAVDVASIAGLFLVATALGTLARAWAYPAHLMRTAGPVATSTIGAVASVVVNNLPAAVLLGSRSPTYPLHLLFGLDIGPNLAVTGSLSALVWWQAARSLGARPSARRYSAVGLVLVPVTIAAAVLARRALPL
jgi:arsenical pump membrane protein